MLRRIFGLRHEHEAMYHLPFVLDQQTVKGILRALINYCTSCECFYIERQEHISVMPDIQKSKEPEQLNLPFPE